MSCESTIPVQDVRDLIAEMEAIVRNEMPLVEPPVYHHFSHKVYAREMFIPKGVLVIGKIHKHESLAIVSAGDISILSIEGVARVQAPFTVVSPPGVKRAVYAHEDTIWTTILGTEETDLEKIEEQFIVKSYDELNPLEVEAWIKQNLVEG